MRALLAPLCVPQEPREAISSAACVAEAEGLLVGPLSHQGPFVRLSAARRVPGILDMVAVNFVYSAVQASAQMTLLPVLLTTHLGFSPATVGSVFAGMAATGVVGSRFVAGLSDTIGGRVRPLCLRCPCLPHMNGQRGDQSLLMPIATRS